LTLSIRHDCCFKKLGMTGANEQMKMKLNAAALVAFLLVAAPAFADTVTGDFNIRGGLPATSDGTITLTLNGDGTITASLSVLSGSGFGPIIAFGMDTKTTFQQSDFSAPPAITGIRGDSYGQQNTSFDCATDCGYNETWQIGTIGQFTSVSQAINGGALSSHAFVVITLPRPHVVYQWAADPAVAAVPEPSTWAMLILGFCGLGFLAHRRKKLGLSAA
jgi:PEP-CTERM motif-containing protein